MIFTLLFVQSVTSDAIIIPLTTITHQACPTLPPSCSGTLDCEFMHVGPPGTTILDTVVVQVAIVDYDEIMDKSLTRYDMLRNVEQCHKYKIGNGTLSPKTALEDALATMELFRVNRNFWDEMIQKRDFRVTKTSEPTLAPWPTAAPACLPPTDDYIVLSLMSAVFGRGKKREFIPLQVTLMDYGYNILLKLDQKYEKVRDLQRSLPIRFDPILRKNPPSLDVFVKNELNISLSILRAKAMMLLYQKYRTDDTTRGLEPATLCCRNLRKDGLENVQKVGKGGFGSVFSAMWLDGKRIVSGESHHSVQSCTPSFIAALKTLPGSQKNFLKEKKKRSRLLDSNLEVYGLNQTTTNNEYLMVFNMQIKEAFILSNKESVNMKSEQE
ncbi:hypothetical protein C2G38_2205595 [Gigaspora rosea]|uniref:Protein kinase domain-containing protein n=1 Tax=Gigaspora rosea TaxID=44941 RepID=A0A397UTY2_9GLOM|nr:hypothetical protein C2G38_2205595 [Gigaspora rosea]